VAAGAIFLRRVGGIILVLTVALWFLASFPAPPGAPPARHRIQPGRHARPRAGAGVRADRLQLADQHRAGAGHGRARGGGESLGTVYALSATGDDTAQALQPLIASSWSLATGLSLLAWFVFAPQCLSTLATVKRETGGWARRCRRAIRWTRCWKTWKRKARARPWCWCWTA
jgi:ferrous iron transport protein B